MEEIQTGSFGGGFFAHFKSRKVILYSVLGLVVVAGAVTATVIISKNSNSAVAVCSKQPNLPLMNQAVKDISSDNVPSLVTVATKVSALTNYTKDPNCLYVLIQASIKSGNLTHGQIYLSDLEKNYPKNGFIAVFGNQSLQKIKTEFNNEEEAILAANNNTIYLPGPTK